MRHLKIAATETCRLIRSLALLLLAATPGSAAASSAEPELHHYQVSVSPDLAMLSVRACFTGSLPTQLRSDNVIAAEATTEMRLVLDGRKIAFRPRGNVANFERPSDDACIEWDTDLERIAAIERMTLGYRAGDSLLLDPASWLWRPWRLSANRDIEIRFILPPGMSVSVPWQPLGEEFPASRFRFARQRFDWPALMAIGRLHHRRIEVPGGVLRMAMADGPARPAPDLAARWLRPAALAVSELTGRFPRPSPQVLVVPLDVGLDAAPWAQVNRGGGAAAHFFMNTRADWSVFADDWIAAHELSHLAMPFLQRSDAWLSEGFASYYQNILRARIGLLGERQAWQKLVDGFRRGQQAPSGGSLRDVSRSSQRRQHTRRIYWSGAAIALLADVAVRRETGGEWTLDRAVATLADCCFDEDKAWRASEIFAHFDAVSGTDAFTTVHDETVYSQHFPGVRQTLEFLGVMVGDDRRVWLDDSAPGAAIRRAITQPASTKKAAAPAAAVSRTR